MNIQETLLAVTHGLEVTSQAAQLAAPIVTILNPAAGILLSTFAPVAHSFFVTQENILINWRKDMTQEEMLAALNQTMSGLVPIEKLT